MIVLSFNIRGISSDRQRTAFKKLLEMVGPDIIPLEETMVLGIKVVDFFLKILPS